MHNEGYWDDRSPPRGPRRGRCVMLYRPPRLIDHHHDAPLVNCVVADLLKDLGQDSLTSTTRLNLLLFELFTFAFIFGPRAPSTPFTSQVQHKKCQNLRRLKLSVGPLQKEIKQPENAAFLSLAAASSQMVRYVSGLFFLVFSLINSSSFSDGPLLASAPPHQSKHN